ncbi:hypothetical protein BR93DRAFT_272783 [Coniochaeta sp. PMI_546]|nr:hypothetical protein BR93DRAFT_272783 [Coniochaeta sp. PMI_546]
MVGDGGETREEEGGEEGEGEAGAERERDTAGCLDREGATPTEHEGANRQEDEEGKRPGHGRGEGTARQHAGGLLHCASATCGGEGSGVVTLFFLTLTRTWPIRRWRERDKKVRMTVYHLGHSGLLPSFEHLRSAYMQATHIVSILMFEYNGPARPRKARSASFRHFTYFFLFAFSTASVVPAGVFDFGIGTLRMVEGLLDVEGQVNLEQGIRELTI